MRKPSERQIVKQLNQVHAETITRLEEDLKACAAGTNTRTKIIEAIAKEKRTHIEFMARFGIIASNLGMATKPKYQFRVLPPDATAKAHTTPDDEAIRAQLYEQFPDTRPKNEGTDENV